jgi:hypothetical protein
MTMIYVNYTVCEIWIFSEKLSTIQFHNVECISQSDCWSELNIYKTPSNILFYLGLKVQDNQNIVKPRR